MGRGSRIERRGRRSALVLLLAWSAALATEPGGPAARGRELLDRALEAMGGAERIDAVRSLEQIGPILLKMGDGEMAVPTRVVFGYPDRMRVEIVTAFGSITRVLTPAGGFVRSPKETRPMTGDERGPFQEQMHRDVLLLLQSRDRPGFQARALGAREIDGVRMEQVAVRLGGVESTLAIDPESGRVRALIHRGGHPRTGEPGEYVTVFSDFRDVNGVSFPFGRSVQFEGEPSSSLESESVRIDFPLDDAEFTLTAGG